MALFVRSDLRYKAREKRIFESARTILKSDSKKWDLGTKFDIFLSHSALDAPELAGLKATIEEMGFSVYVDWEDHSLDPGDVSPDTARKLRARMKDCRSLFYATSPNAGQSRWMPWELGYFDGLKNEMVAILPVLDEQSRTRDLFRGQEYLGLYPYVTQDRPADSNEMTLWIREDEDTYMILKAWLQGYKPSKH